MPTQQATDAWTNWATQVLNDIHAPTTPTNLQTLWNWSVKESGRNPVSNGSIQNNPLNTTQPVPGSHPANSVGVQSFPDVSSSVNATVMTLLNGRYPAIVRNLRNSIPTSQWGADAGAQLGTWGSGTNWLGWNSRPPQASQYFQNATSGAASALGSTAGQLAADASNPFTLPAQIIGQAIGGSITNVFAQGLWVALMAFGGLLMLVALALLAVTAFQSAPAPVKRLAGTAAGLTPVGRGGKVAKAAVASRATKSAAPAPAPKPEIRAGGRNIEVTNPESRERLRRAGYAV